MRSALLAGLLLAAACRAPHSGALDAAAVRRAPFDVEHYALDIDLDPAARSIHATCTLRLWPTQELDVVHLDFAGDRMVVENVRDAGGRDLRFEHRGEDLAIDLAEPVARGSFVELAIRYGGAPSKGLWFRGDRAGQPSQVFTHGECRDAHWWFPCFDELGDRATSEIVVRMPETWTSVCAGERIERRVESGRAIERWRTTCPHPAYLETLVAGAFAVKTATWDGVPLAYVCEPELEDELEATFAETDEVLDFLSRVTGRRYPYPKYAQCCVDDFPFGGMENMSASTLTSTAVSDARGRADAPPLGLVAHEAAHQWFGDLLTCASWAEAWLNEGFASYFGALYVESAHGNDEFLLQIQDTRDGQVARDSGKNVRPIVHGDARYPMGLFFSGHVYQGGAARLHMLRVLLGDDAFFRGVRLYVGMGANTSVTTDDFRRALEEASGRDLRAYFRRWFFEAGHPVVDVKSEHDAERGVLAIDVRQTQDGAPFPFPFEVEVADWNGIRQERFDVSTAHARFEIAQPDEPRWVRADPRCAIPGVVREERTLDAWFELLALSPDSVGRRDAARFLRDKLRASKDEGASNLHAGVLWARLVDLERDPRVRLVLVEAISGRKDARSALSECAHSDESPAVRAAVLRALETFGADEDLARTARTEVERGASYAAMAAAHGLWAVAAPEHAFERLQSALNEPSPHGVYAARIVDQLARLADSRVTELLRATLRDGSREDDVRGAAARALAPLASRDAGVRGEILALLDSPRFRVRRAGLAALATSRASDVIARVARLAETSVYETERMAAQDLVDAARRESGG